MGTDAYGSFEIGEWRVSAAAGELIRGDQSVRAEPKVMDLLVLLAEHDGAVVSHRQIMERLWPRVVVGEDTLARTVSKLRKTLGDTDKPARYIGTVPKRGYRLLAAVNRIDVPEPDLPARDAARESELPVARPPEPRWRRFVPTATLALVIAIVTASVAMFRASTPEAATTRVLAQHAEDFYFQYTWADNQAAITLYERILAQRPDYARAYAGLANALAQNAIRWPASGEPDAPTFTRLGDALRAGHLESDRGRALLDRAQRFAELGVMLAPKDSATYKAFGLVRSARGDFAGALAAYHRALALDADAWGVMINIGDLLEIQGREVEAVRYFESALEVMGRVYESQSARIRPWYAELGVTIGDSYLARGELTEAQQAYRRVLRYSPNHQVAASQLSAAILRSACSKTSTGCPP